MPLKNNKKICNVLMLAPTPFFSDRGCHVRILNSYERMGKSGARITLLTYPLGRNLDGINTVRVAMLLGYKKLSPGFSFYKPFLDILMLAKATGIMRRERIDLVYAHLHEGIAIGIILRTMFGKKLIYDAQGSLAGELSGQGTISKKGIARRIIFAAEKFLSNCPDEIIANSNSMKKFLRDECGVKKPIQIISDDKIRGVILKNASSFTPNLALPKGKMIAVYAGGMDLYKGIDYLIKAIPFVKKNIHFLLIGYPFDDAKKLAKGLGVLDRITFTGRVKYEELGAYLALGDIALAPKTSDAGEGNGKLFAYKSAKLRVVCFDNKTNREILGKSGVYAKEKSFEELANKINEAV
ncbi:Glycosyl transferases group 1 [uncultured archaeon]|nr:Glycosyl transferases group 1 [uncultured archaeon]